MAKGTRLHQWGGSWDQEKALDTERHCKIVREWEGPQIAERDDQSSLSAFWIRYEGTGKREEPRGKEERVVSTLAHHGEGDSTN